MDEDRQEDPDRQDSDEESFDGSWKSKSKTSSSQSSLSDNKEQLLPPERRPVDRIDCDLEDYLLKHGLSLEVIRSWHESSNKLVESEPIDASVSQVEQAKKLVEEELRLARKEADSIKHKYKQLQEQLKRELGAFDEQRIDNILKNSGAAAYVESLRSTIKTKNDTIKSQSAIMKQLERDNDNLTERLKGAQRLISDQRTAIQQAHSQAQAKTNDFELDRRRNTSHHGSVSLAMSPDLPYNADYSIPLPPPVEQEEILSLIHSPPDAFMTSANSSAYNGHSFLNSSIPPPPEIDVSDILREVNESSHRVKTET